MALVEPITLFAETQPCRPRAGIMSLANVSIDSGYRLLLIPSEVAPQNEMMSPTVTE